MKGLILRGRQQNLRQAPLFLPILPSTRPELLRYLEATTLEEPILNEWAERIIETAHRQDPIRRGGAKDSGPLIGTLPTLAEVIWA
jgi:hypothetical protein